jgi:hypothetical protein
MANGGKIMNASRFTKLDVWDRINFDDLFRCEQEAVVKQNPFARDDDEVSSI